jgi:hypothetical protein
MSVEEFDLTHSHVLESTKVKFDKENDLVTIKTGDISVFFTFGEIEKIYNNIQKLKEEE